MASNQKEDQVDSDRRKMKKDRIERIENDVMDLKKIVVKLERNVDKLDRNMDRLERNMDDMQNGLTELLFLFKNKMKVDKEMAEQQQSQIDHNPWSIII